MLDEAENQHSQAELLGITLDRPTLYPAQARRYRWSEWRFKSGRELLDFVSDEVFPYMSSLYGYDVSGQMIRVALMNLVLHGVPKARLRRANSLSETGGLTEDDKSRRYKVVIANPPFAGLLPKDSIRADLPTNSKKSELLFLAIMMDSLAPGGRCAVMVPEGLLFGSTEAHVDELLDLETSITTGLNTLHKQLRA